MSYDLWTWDSSKHPSASATFADVTKTFLDLQEVDDGLNPKFVEFARQLVERYPSSDMFAANDRDALDSVWAGNPLNHAQKEERALFGISLLGDDKLGVMRHLVQAANAAGLTVFDDQLGMAFLPNGQVLPPEAQAQWAAVKQELAAQRVPISKAQMRKIAISQFEVMAQKHGFVKRKKEDMDAEFYRPIEGGEQIIWVQIYGTAPYIRCGLSFKVVFEEVSRIYWKAFPLGGGGGGPMAFHFCLCDIAEHIKEREIPVASAEDVRAIVTLAESTAMPLLERARNLRDLDVLIHQGGYRPDLKSRYFKNLIIARLVSNPNYEALAQAQLRIHEATGGITLEDFKKLVKYLKEEVVPLT